MVLRRQPLRRKEKLRKRASRKNGKKGGRPSYNNINESELTNTTFVILTQNQYNTLLGKYGYKIIKKALMIFEQWLKSSPNAEKYRGKNNYGHFRADGWVINSAKINV